MLELKNICKKFKKRKVLVDINLTLEDSGFVAITGESGSGKSTLINIISGIEAPDSGEIILNGNLMLFQKESERISNILKKISYMPQSQVLLYNKTVYGNLKEIEKIYHLADENQMDEILKQVHLNESYKNRIVSTLSTGEAQRVCIAISLLKKSSILILDEATENLDASNRELILRILKEISKEKLVILVTHDTFLAKKYVDRLITIFNQAIYKDENYNTLPVPFEEEITEEEHIKGKKRKKIGFPFKNIIFYLLIPLIIVFFISQISIWIKPNISSEFKYPSSYYQRNASDMSGNIYAEQMYFTKEELQSIYQDENTYLVFNIDYDIEGFIDYDLNYKHSKRITSFDEYIVSDTFIELNPAFSKQYKVIEVIKNERPVLILNYDLTLDHLFLGEAVTFDLIYKAVEESLFSKTTIITANKKDTLELGIPIINCYDDLIESYYKNYSLELGFGTVICGLMLGLSIILFILLEMKKSPFYYKTIAFYKMCGQTNLEIRGKLKLDFYIIPFLLILICSGIIHLSIYGIFQSINYNHDIFRFDSTTYLVSFGISIFVLIILNEIMHFIVFNSNLKKMIKSRFTD